MTAPPCPRRRGLSLRALVLAALLVAGLLPALARAESPVVRVSCDGTGAVVPADFLGLSIEWSAVEPWLGRNGQEVVPSTVALLRGLGRGVLRVGGNSQDGYRFNALGSTERNTAFRGTISRGMVDALLEVARQSGWSVVLGVNLKIDKPVEAALLTAYAVSRDRGRRLSAVQIGNEPDAYFRSDTLGYLDRVGEYVDLLQANPTTASLPLVGPDISNNVTLDYVRAFRRQFGERAAYLAFHAYGNQPSVSGLLGADVQRAWRDRIRAVQEAAGGLPVRMDEGNSVGNGGLEGVSNVLGSTAWLVSTLLTGAQAGLAGYNLHAWDGLPYPSDRRTSYYTPFVVRGGATSPRPPFYALALLRDLPGTQLCPLEAASPDVRSWATQDPVSGVQRVYAVHARSRGPVQVVTVSAPGRTDTALLRTLTDPRGCLGRSTGVDGAQLTSAGRLVDQPRLVRASAGGAFSFGLRPCESAVLELPPR